ncbi:MAG TPA: hypothetical protein VJW20_20670 [Candidatus Angelobacter sp.]|nr:hypothetical protein [Candidatus Angelobacter sp.]
MGRRLWLFVLLAATTQGIAAQDCTNTVLVSFYDQLTTNEIQTLKSDDVEVRMSGSDLPILGFSRDFDNRLLILLETEGAAKSDKLEDLVEMVTRQARTAPDGKPVAFGIFVQKAVFTKGFQQDEKKRTAAVNDVIEEAGSLGKHVALWDSLHEALQQFGPHQPGDTVLLIGDPYDDISHHSAVEVEKEFLSSGTRFFMMRRMHASRVDRDFTWNTHDLEKSVLARMTQETGGLLSEYVASLIRFAWAGYMVTVKLPPEMNHPHKWKVLFRGPAAHMHRKTNFYYPTLLPPCNSRAAGSYKETENGKLNQEKLDGAVKQEVMRR